MTTLSDTTRARLRTAARWGALVVALIAVRAWQTRDAASGVAPMLRARTTQGTDIDLAALRGDAVAVHFWATWCGVCAAEQGNVESVAHGGRMITVASASGSAADVERYTRANGIAAPVLVDSSGALARAYGVTAYPTTFYLDGDGHIRHVEVGYTTTLGMRARLALAALGI